MLDVFDNSIAQRAQKHVNTFFHGVDKTISKTIDHLHNHAEMQRECVRMIDEVERFLKQKKGKMIPSQHKELEILRSDLMRANRASFQTLQKALKEGKIKFEKLVKQIGR